MAKKIYDIKPPKVARKSAKKIKEFLVEEKVEAPKVQQQVVKQQQKREGRPVWVPISIGCAVVLLIVCIYLFFKLPKAEIAIWPKVDVLSFEQKVTADKSAELIDSEKIVIPAKSFQTTKTESQDFPATGNASDEGVASGTITVYNKYDPPTAVTLKTGTHFLSDSGKLFVATQKIVIPSGTKSGSKIIPGSVKVKIQAVEGGDSYNIAPSNFSIPGLKGTSSYYSVYASSTEAMSGGYAGKVKKVTADDITQAKDVMTKKATESAIADLKAQIPADYIILDEAVISSVTDTSTKTKSGTVADNFTYQATVKSSALAFKKSDLESLVKNYVVSQIPEGKVLLDNSLKIDYTAGTVDMSDGKLTLNVNFSSGAYKSVDKNSLALSFIGENANQITQTIDNALGDQVSKTSIKFWPFWVTSAPSNQKAVNVELKFE